MKVLVLYSATPETLPGGRRRCEFDLSAGVKSIVQVLDGAIAVSVRGEAREILDALSKHQPDVVFNVCESPLGRADLEAHAAALLEWVGIPFTGSGSETLGLCRNKDRTKAVLSAAGVAVPRSGPMPCIVKPANDDGSGDIHADSVCRSQREIKRTAARIKGPVLVEEFLPGREFAVSLWGRRTPEWSSIGECRFSNGLLLNTYAAKWQASSTDFVNAPMVYDHSLESSLRDAILKQAREAWDAVKLRGYARVDIRLDSCGMPRVLEVNPNPDLSPGAGIHRAIVEAGWTWAEFVRKQIEWAY